MVSWCSVCPRKTHKNYYNLFCYKKFPGCVIFRNNSQNPFDLTPPDFCFKKCPEDKVYVTSPQTNDHLKNNICAVIDNINLNMCNKQKLFVILYTINRIRYCDCVSQQILSYCKFILDIKR